MKIKALTRCTAWDPPKEELVPEKTLGPDHGWTLLSGVDLQTFCLNQRRPIIHRGRVGYDHVCAAYGEWAFDAEDSSYIRTVVFLHYEPPGKAVALLGAPDKSSGAKVFSFSGQDLWNTYLRLVASEGGEVHVWKRVASGEIALDFCLSDNPLMQNKEGRIQRPSFIPR